MGSKVQPGVTKREGVVARGRVAVFAGTFDPLTMGHLDVIRRASQLFDKVIVAIATNRSKAPMFEAEERLALTKESCANFQNVEVAIAQGLTTVFARGAGAQFLVRGIRSESDIGGEMQMAAMNRALAESIDTVFIPTSREYSHISSTLVREIAHFGGDIMNLVPAPVMRAINEKLSPSQASRRH